MEDCTAHDWYAAAATRATHSCTFCKFEREHHETNCKAQPIPRCERGDRFQGQNMEFLGTFQNRFLVRIIA
jgi:hypothetical protein